jgi:hypothetical protein
MYRKNYLFFKMLVENSNVVTFVSGTNVKMQLPVLNVIICSFLEPITNLKRAIAFMSQKPLLVRA